VCRTAGESSADESGAEGGAAAAAGEEEPMQQDTPTNQPKKRGRKRKVSHPDTTQYYILGLWIQHFSSIRIRIHKIFESGSTKENLKTVFSSSKNQYKSQK
jgi:hypothetical protein